MNANERILNIMLEAKKSESCTKAECKDECGDFEITINDTGFAPKLVGDVLKFGNESMPVKKTTKCTKCNTINDECGTECDECGGACTEAYLIDSRCLDIYMEDNEIYDEMYALNNIAEHYGYDVKDTVVVFESDEINKGLIKNTMRTGELGLMRKYNHMIKNCLNHGITCCKKS